MQSSDEQTTAEDKIRERAIQAAVTEMSLFSGNLDMKVRQAIARYELILEMGRRGVFGD